MLTESIKISDALEQSHSYPPSLIPKQPVLSLGSFFGGRKHVSSVLDAGAVRLVTSGRIAIALALKQMNIRAGDAVLVPSYHCASMIEPVIWIGAKPVFYKINFDTSVDLEDVSANLGPNVKALMVTNYFGFPQNLSKIRAFCDAHGLLMLEDCAHTFLGEHNGQPVGSFGDYAIASSMKFFPIYEGGCLASSRHSLDTVELVSAGAGFEAKIAFNTIEGGFEYRRLGMAKMLLKAPMALKNFIWGQIKSRKVSGVQSLVPNSSEGGFGFDPKWIDRRSSWVSRSILRKTSRHRMSSLRRKYYLQLNDALAGVPGCRPLFKQLPDKVSPWVFPLLMDNPKPIFESLKQSGVPIIRFGEYLWPGVDASVCANSAELSERVFQFPCHQELRASELEWMIAKIKDALHADAARTK